MRWLRRSVLLCLIITMATPAPAEAWFAWLDRLSGPGPWYGLKVDVRALCFGAEIPPIAVAPDSEDFKDPGRVSLAVEEVRTNIDQLRRIGQGLGILRPSQLRALEADFEIIRAAAVIGTPGIFISLCRPDILRSFALEIGFTGQGTPGSDSYANDNSIWMTTATAGFSYRIPLPVNRDVIDLGTNIGAYRFYSRGFQDFSGFTIEPFVDLHLPTRLQLDGSKWERFFGRFTVRGGLQFFPGGFEAERFAARPGTPDISGREANPSVTVFFRMNH
jgi:hypothetical protein